MAGGTLFAAIHGMAAGKSYRNEPSHGVAGTDFATKHNTAINKQEVHMKYEAEKLHELRQKLAQRCIAELNKLASELSVIESDYGFSVELRHSGALQLMSVASQTALELGFTMRMRSEVSFMHDRFVSVVSLDLLEQGGENILSVQRYGEALPNRLIKKTGEVVPSETAVRTAETRAFKRALAALVPEVEEKMIYLSKLVEGWHKQKNADARTLESWLRQWMQKVGFKKADLGNTSNPNVYEQVSE